MLVLRTRLLKNETRIALRRKADDSADDLPTVQYQSIDLGHSGRDSEFSYEYYSLFEGAEHGASSARKIEYNLYKMDCTL